MTTPARCPHCGGPWLYSLTFQHRHGCRLQPSEDARRAADMAAFNRCGTAVLTRPITAAEHRLFTARDGTPPTPDALVTVTQHTTTIHHKALAARKDAP